VHKFDTAASGLEVTSKEKEELERRANVAALDLRVMVQLVKRCFLV
jgi:hypothetical protein